jgi:hypothetical protein
MRLSGFWSFSIQMLKIREAALAEREGDRRAGRGVWGTGLEPETVVLSWVMTAHSAAAAR